MVTDTNKPYSVNLWSAHPESGEDACDTGTEFATLEEARACMADLDKYFNMRYFRTSPWVELDGPDVYEVVYDAEAHKRMQKERAAYEEMERRERAMQAGMAFGCQGYNEEMGYD